VYPEDLPDEVPPLAPIRPITQLIGHLEARSHFRLTYPLDALVAAKQEGQLVYPKTNSHWSTLGAFVAYRLLATAIAPMVKLNRLEWEDVRFEEGVAVGDLGFKVEPEEASTRMLATVERPRARLVSDNRVPGSGALVITECEQAPATTCLVFGDSFTHQLLPFFAASFGRMVFAQLAFMDEGLVDIEEPDVVITVLNERYLMRTPKDGPSRSLDDVVRRKPHDAPGRRTMSFWEEPTPR
jgi:hypothetical protein